MDLANSETYRELLYTLDMTTTDDVCAAVRRNLIHAILTIAEARVILTTVGFPEPDDQSREFLRKYLVVDDRSGWVNFNFHGRRSAWATIHAMETGVITTPRQQYDHSRLDPDAIKSVIGLEKARSRKRRRKSFRPLRKLVASAPLDVGEIAPPTKPPTGGLLFTRSAYSGRHEARSPSVILRAFPGRVRLSIDTPTAPRARGPRRRAQRDRDA